MRVIELNKIDSVMEERWDNFIYSHPEGEIYFTNHWLKIIQKESGEELIRLICFNERNEILGIMPLVTTKGFPFGIGGIATSARLSSLPRTPIGGPLSVSPDVSFLLLDEAVKLLNRLPGKILQIKSISDKLGGSKNKFICVPWRKTYILEIPDDKNAEIRFGNSKNHTKIKTGVNKSKNSGVSLKVSNSISDLKEWHKLFLHTMRFHSTPARSLPFFEELWNSFYETGKMKLFKAVYNNRLIAGSIFFYYNKKVHYAFNASHRNVLTLRPNDLIHWEAIHDAQKKGFQSYDFGEVSNSNTGLADYKKKWGTKSIDLYHYYYPKEEKLAEGSIDFEGGWKQKIIGKLPLRVTAYLGKWTYKYL